MIDGKEFVTGHTLRHIQQQPRHLLIRGQDFFDSQVKYVSIVDDETFPHQKFNLFVPDVCKDAKLVGSSYGLFCLYDDKTSMVVIWNPSIRKTALTTVVPCKPCSMIDVFFGVCHNTLDPKIVKITRITNQVEVFTLSLGAWRSPLSNTCPRKWISMGIMGSSQAFDGFIYWDALDTNNEGPRNVSLIMSFDLTSEEFTELYLPTTPFAYLYVSTLRESIGVFDLHLDTRPQVVNVWIMRGRGCTRSFEKLYHINLSDASISIPRAFRSSGTPIAEMENNQFDSPVALAAYEPGSKDITEIWNHGIAYAFRVHSYMETLLLLGH
uniref:F-box/kelch-repeat protein At3g23880-like n=1 Tax=Erigeron canadensis TaxID=72917 RepID=UPI001CB9C011|nr:F-box/kelch-repeat protein At3g23880-like [Erigeron canadensis]